MGLDYSIRHRAAPVVVWLGKDSLEVVSSAYRYDAIAVVHVDVAMIGAVGAPEDTASGPGPARFALGRPPRYLYYGVAGNRRSGGCGQGYRFQVSMTKLGTRLK